MDNRKCCFDGCGNSCIYPEITTNCLHQRAAIDVIMRSKPNDIFQVFLKIKNFIFKMACTANGDFESIQRFKSISWCVDEKGKEIQGTKIASDMLKNCGDLKIKSCPILSCDQNCPFG